MEVHLINPNVHVLTGKAPDGQSENQKAKTSNNNINIYFIDWLYKMLRQTFESIASEIPYHYPHQNNPIL